MRPEIRGHCAFCAKPVRRHETAAFRIRGFQIERKGGGANQIVGAERHPNRIYHETCVRSYVRKHARGLADQEAMF